jgi:hypothetical protein
MDRSEALGRFVKENLAQLSDEAASKEAVKRARQDFFRKHSLGAAEHFTGREVAESVAKIVGKAWREKPLDKVLETLGAIPHIRDELGPQSISEIAQEARLGLAPRLSPGDLSKIGHEGYLEELEGQFRQRAESVAQARLNDERRRLLETMALLGDRQELLDKAKSSLEAVAPDADLELLGNQEPSPADTGALPVWWKEFRLESDPFSSNRGLSEIPERKFDDVVVRTSFVQSWVDRIESHPESFFGKTEVVLGEFGSGKTTIFQLVCSKAATRGLVPIITSIHPDVSVSRLMSQLIGQLEEALLQSFPQLTNVAYSSSTEIGDDITRLIHVLSEINRRATTTRGFLVCVDGLHKTETYLKQSLEFLAQLQTLQERFELRKVRVGILVAGSTRWETELRSNPSLSGSFYSIDRIPDVSEDQAVEAVIRRISSFTSEGSAPPTIIRAPLRTAYQVLVQRLLRPPTFRDYLDHVRDRFVARDYSTVGVSLRLHSETIRQVKRLVDSSPLATSYRALDGLPSSGSRVRSGLRVVLPELCVRKGIKDRDPFVEKYKGTFVALLRHGWIEKRLDPTDHSLVWHLSERVVEFLQAVQASPLKVLPSDSLEALFTDVKEVTPQETESIYGPIVRQMETMVATWRVGLPDLSDRVNRSLTQVKSIERKCRLEGYAPRAEVSAEVRVSVTELLRALVLTLQPRETPLQDPVEEFRALWCCPENFDAMLQVLSRTTTFEPSKPETYGFLLSHAQALSDLCEILTSVVRGEGVCRLAGRDLTSGELERLHAARLAFLGQQYQVVVDKLGELVEAKIRDIVPTAARSAVGNRVLSLLPPDVRLRLKEPPRGHPRSKRTPDENFLFAVNRSEYSKVLFNGDMRRVLFGQLLADADVAPLKDGTELQFSLGDRAAHNDRPNYFREKATEIGTVLQWAPRFCELLNRVAHELIVGSEFKLEKLESGVAFRFDTHTPNGAEQRLSPEEVEALVRDILDRLEADDLVIPPFEPALLSIHNRPEVGLAGLRACKEQGLVSVQPVKGAFGFRAAITDEGTRRLGRIRKARSGGAGADDPSSPRTV